MLAISKILCYYLIASKKCVCIIPFNFIKNAFNLQLKYVYFAAVVKLADALDSKSSGLIPRAGSTPASGTNKKREWKNPFSLFTLLP